MEKICIALAVVLATCGAAHADPIFTPIFTALFSAAGLTGTALATITSIGAARATRLLIGRRSKL